MSATNLQVLLASRPQGWVTENNFSIVETPLPQPRDGEVLVRNQYLSLDPYMRGRMYAEKSYAVPVALGAVMGKIRPNFFFGIRTPWTLTSKRAWTRTHRLGGFVFIAVGLVGIVAGLLVPPAALIVDVGGILLGSAALAVYSWRVWLADPDRIEPAGTRPE